MVKRQKRARYASDRIWHRNYFRRARVRRLPPHGFVGQAHCAECGRAYHREYMRERREIERRLEQ